MPQQVPAETVIARDVPGGTPGTAGAASAKASASAEPTADRTAAKEDARAPRKREEEAIGGVTDRRYRG